VMLMVWEFSLEATGEAPDPEAALTWLAWGEAEASRKSDMTIEASSFISVILSGLSMNQTESRPSSFILDSPGLVVSGSHPRSL